MQTTNEFVDRVSHDFRTPLAVIQEYAALLQEGCLGEMNDEQIDILNIVGDRCNDLNVMVDDLLDSSKLSAGIIDINRSREDLGEIISCVTPRLLQKAQVSGVSLEFDIQCDLPPIFCDGEKVARVVTSLARNAIKHAGDHGQVCVRAHSIPTQNEVQISVADNGPGIDPECLPFLLQQFGQLGTQTRSSTKGLSAGLTVVRELVSLNFGDIQVESEPDIGTTFSFTIPINDLREVLTRHLGWLNRSKECEVALLNAEIRPDATADEIREVNGFWNYSLCSNDLIFPIENGKWLLLACTPRSEVSVFMDQLRATEAEINRSRSQGPLPDFELVVEGTWKATQLAEILDQTDRMQEQAMSLAVSGLRIPDLAGV